MVGREKGGEREMDFLFSGSGLGWAKVRSLEIILLSHMGGRGPSA